MKMKKAPVVTQSSVLRGLKKIQALFLISCFTGTTVVTPDSVNGNENSTYSDLSARMVTSPTTASKFC